MAALSLRNQGDIDGFMTSFTGSQRYIMDYLIEEVLDGQPKEMRDFLLKTSIIERLTPSLCDFVTGNDGSNLVLAKLEQVNLFLIPLDESRHWYRYHHLFAELLRHQLEGAYGGKEVSRLHQLASKWYEDSGMSGDAVQHALAAQSWERAIGLIFSIAEDYIRRGEMLTLLNWFRLIPDKELQGRPNLYRQYANVLETVGHIKEAETALGHLEQSAAKDNDSRGELIMLQAGLARRRGAVALATELAEKGLSLLTPENLVIRARTSLTLGFLLFEGPSLLDEAWTRLTDAYEMALETGDYWVLAGAGAYLAQILWLRGKLSQAAEISQRATEIAGKSPAASVPR
jgi:LuxR family maltose regulon positive regulatory protein